ncbi:MAG: serine/threonine-protein phosphatase [Firmicutes bacterium]|nr:serine/threonine-protein phosphatase [Bacillota bacterium]
MSWKLEAAVGCHMGRVRDNNEDNLFFNGRVLELIHPGLRHAQKYEFELEDKDLCFCVFDGMGGEEAGEVASYVAAKTLQRELVGHQDVLLSPRERLFRICESMNLAVCGESERRQNIRMGSTFVLFYFLGDEVYVCNLGDSKAFRLRGEEWMQISEDHVESLPPAFTRGKPRLTQHLGIRPDELQLVPYLAKGRIEAGDQYLLCSDGLTDMVSKEEICRILQSSPDARECVENLIATANDRGGKDNISIILIRIPEES